MKREKPHLESELRARDATVGARSSGELDSRSLLRLSGCALGSTAL